MKAFLSKGNEQVEVRPAATAVVLREGAEGFEVLLLCRSKKSTFADSVWVFPGGGIEKEDYPDDGMSSEPDMVAVTRNAAVRETAEECGLILQPDRLEPYSHWTTPIGPPKRYATWFYFYLVQRGMDTVEVDNQEIVDHQWLTPEQALVKHSAGKLSLLPPTLITLKALSEFSNAQSAIDQLKTTEFVTLLPKATRHDKTTVMLYPGDAGYESCDASVEGPRHRSVLSAGIWFYDKSY